MTELSEDEIEGLRDKLIEHGSIFGASNCHLCGVSRCEIWVETFDQLAAAGELMIAPEKLPPKPPERPR
jgi:hypothetical protein